jgi:HPt (histidine-containing phosphotransfer) domain-containing protein
MTSNPTGSGWNLIYYALGAFAVFSTGAAVFLSYTQLQQYEASVAVNRTWADRTARYADWGGIASEGNAPGNDVFENGDVAGESARLDAIVARFDAHHETLQADLKQVDPAQVAVLNPRLEAAANSFHAQVQEARAIFAAFEEGDREKAGAHMATMDRFNAQAAADLGALAKEVQAIQNRLFADQLDAASQIQYWQYGLIALVMLMVGFTIAYGRKLAAIFRDAQERIDRRNRDLRLVLDNVGEGLVTVDLNGRLADEASAEFFRLFGKQAGGLIWDIVADQDAAVRASMELGFESLRDGFMPVEITLSQLPEVIQVHNRHIRLGYRPIVHQGTLGSLLVVAKDVTDALAREKREQQQAEMLQLFNRVTHDRMGVIEFAREAEQLVQTLGDGADQLPVSVAKRLLHTLKGNAGFFGLKRLAAQIHAHEDALDEQGAWTPESARTLRAAWADNASMIRHLLGDSASSLIEVEPEELQAALRIAERAKAPLVVKALESWRQERLTPRFERIRTQVQGLAARLGKEVEVHCDLGVRRWDGAGWEPFWASLTHVLRNAVDHGIERPEERVAAGKTPTGHLALRASVRPDRFVFEVEDDGRGIDWDKLASRARERGFPAETEDDLLQVLLSAGVSTADAVTDISGRGIGMSAVAAATSQLGGDIQVRSAAGRGTCFRFELPIVIASSESAAA